MSTTGADLAQPYQILPEDQLKALRAQAEREGIDPKRIRPDGSIEPADGAVVAPEIMQRFLGAARGGDGAIDAQKLDSAMQQHVENASQIRVLDGESGKVEEASKEVDPFTADADTQRAILQKVAYFLDPKLKSPITIIEVRHKAFVLKVPVSQEMIDVSAMTGRLENEPMTEAQSMLYIIGELLKSCVGWLPANGTGIAEIRANLNDPAKWPALRKIEWLNTRDPFFMKAEVMPLWEQYTAWLKTVQPTEAELDFYFSQMR